MSKFNTAKIVLPAVLSMAIASETVAAEDPKIKALEARIAQLEQLLGQQIQTQKKQSQQIESVSVKMSQVSKLSLKSDSSARENKVATIYGSLRPRLTFRDEGDESSTDVTDALSRIGIKGSAKVGDSLTAFYRGEWDVDIEANGDFGDARLAYVGVEGDFGRLAIGKQWHPHYNRIAEVSDIFNHRSSPFGYDTVAPFRTESLLTYSYSNGGFQLDTSIQANGDPDISGNSGDSSLSSDPSHVDSGSVGLGYNLGSAYLGASYLQVQGDNDFERTLAGLAGSWNATDDLYLAFTYQDISVEETGFADRDQYTLDLVGAYSLGNGFKVKAGVFTFDDDVDGPGSDSQDGYNITLEKQLEDLRLFVEWLSRDFDEKDERNTLSLGMRYDFEFNL